MYLELELTRACSVVGKMESTSCVPDVKFSLGTKPRREVGFVYRSSLSNDQQPLKMFVERSIYLCLGAENAH